MLTPSIISEAVKLNFYRFLIILTGISVAACSPLATEQVILDQPAPSGEGQPDQSEAGIAPTWDQATQMDEQGAVVVEATPLNLNTQDSTMEFEIVLDTHSVDLSMDLSQLAILTTDAGITVNATRWDAPRGGHHVTGKLLFPSIVDGKFILDGANSITLQIRDVDSSLREFVWRMQ
jgi:hypothetical protein